MGSECFVRTASDQDRTAGVGQLPRGVFSAGILPAEKQATQTPGLLSEASGSERKKWMAGSSFHLASAGQGPDGQVFMSTSSQT